MMKLITEELLDTVTSQAKENSRLRMNYNFHASMDACAGVCWHFFMMMPVM